MNKYYVIAGAAVVAVAAWIFLGKQEIPPLQELPTANASSISAEATLNPEQPRAGEPTTITFSFTKPDGSPVDNLMVHHARRVHTLLISEDLSSIGHIHPDDFSEVTDEVVQSGTYSVTYTFPNAGRYIVGVDVMAMEETLAKQFIVNVKGTPGMEKVADKDLRSKKCFLGYQEDGDDRYVNPVITSESEVECPQGYEVTMTPSVERITAGEEVQLQYHVEKDGEAVADLEPYLDAAIHFAIVPSTFDTLLHHHGFADDRLMSDMNSMHETDMEGHKEETEADEGGHAHTSHLPESFGPNLVSENIVFPAAGLYQVFAQVKHEGKIIFSSFMVEVEEGFDEATAKSFNLNLTGRELTPNIVTLEQGDKVILRVSGDEAGEFHVSGYEIEKILDIGETAEVRFTANLPGRYNLELHPEDTEDDIEIGALIVQPK